MKSLRLSPIPIDYVVDSITKYSGNPVEAIMCVYGECKMDWHRAGESAQVCANLMKIDPSRFRLPTIETLQKDYKNNGRTELIDKKEHLGCLAFLCQLVAKVRDKNGVPFKPLFTPCVESLVVLLEADEDIHVGTTLLLEVIDMLFEHEDIAKLQDKLLPVLRNILLESRGSLAVRRSILSILEKYTWTATLELLKMQ